MTGPTPSDPSGQPPPGEQHEPPGGPPPAAPPPDAPPGAPQYGPPPAAPPPGTPQYGQPPGAPQYGSPPAAPGYGNAPSYPSAPQYGPPPADAPTDPPPPLALAVRLMYLGAALSLVNIVLTVLQRNTIRAQLAEAGRLSAESLDAATTATIVLGAVVGLAAAGLWVLNAVYNARGRTWARVLSTVLGGLAVIFALASLSQPESGLSRLLTFVELLLAAAVLVLIWRPESSRYYQARSGVPGA